MEKVQKPNKSDFVILTLFSFTLRSATLQPKARLEAISCRLSVPVHSIYVYKQLHSLSGCSLAHAPRPVTWDPINMDSNCEAGWNEETVFSPLTTFFLGGLSKPVGHFSSRLTKDHPNLKLNYSIEIQAATGVTVKNTASAL
jgi:hypothetical protein